MWWAWAVTPAKTMRRLGGYLERPGKAKLGFLPAAAYATSERTPSLVRLPLLFPLILSRLRHVKQVGASWALYAVTVAEGQRYGAPLLRYELNDSVLQA